MDEDLWSPIVPAGPVREARRRGVRPAVAAAAVLAFAMLPVTWFALSRNDGGQALEVVAAERTDDGVPESVRAFVERWNAPTTTASTVPRTTTTAPSVGSAQRTGRSEPRARARSGAAVDSRALADAEAVAHRFVAAITERDCDGVWSMLSAATVEFLESMEDESGEPLKGSFCAALREEPVPAISVRPPARPLDDGRVVVDLESEGDVEPLFLVREADGHWRVDLLGVRSHEG